MACSKFHALEGPSITAIFGNGIGKVASAFGLLLTKLPPKDVVNALNIGFTVLTGIIQGLTNIVGWSMEAWDHFSVAMVVLKNTAVTTFHTIVDTWLLCRVSTTRLSSGGLRLRHCS